jgi:hypothetical protein
MTAAVARVDPHEKSAWTPVDGQLTSTPLRERMALPSYGDNPLDRN